ncbi:MAG TPA: hypothetical protein PLO61_01285 [Fimbriimonadaceae bacterium]|nr:hypothetical protein [Fimbriimonadaceae bacterium]HRJ33782.1 hypothetical protein [Fimbriimonadaceae bacterium]
MTTFVALLCVANFAQAPKTLQADFDLKVMDQKAGSAKCVFKTFANGNSSRELTLNIEFGGTRGTLKMAETFDANAFPLESVQSSQNGQAKFQVTMKYTKNSVQVTEDAAGKISRRTLKLSGKNTFVDPSVLWFQGTPPKPGTSVKYWAVDDDAAKLEQVSIRYVGPRELTIGRKKVRAHLIEGDVATQYWDDQGFPYQITFKQTPVIEITRRLP